MSEGHQKELPGPAPRKALPAPEGSAHRRRRWLMPTVLLLLLLGCAWGVSRCAASRKKAEAAGKRKSAPIPVAVVQARRGDIGVHLSALGAVTPISTVTVKSRVDGQLMEVRFTEGQTVHKGDLLALIDPSPFQAALTQAEGQQDRDRAQLKNARIDLQRYENVYKQHAISEQQVQTQQALVEQYQGLLRIDAGALQNAQAQLAYTQIRAPFDGKVGLRLVDPGNLVHAGDPGGLLVITQVQPIDVVFSIAEDEVGAVAAELRPGQPMSVEALDRDERVTLDRGRVLTLDNQVDPTTGTVKMKAEFPNAQGQLFPNQFVNARVLLKTLRGATVVPLAAIQRAGEKTSLFVVGEDHKVQNRPVEILASDGGDAAVTGVNPGDAIVSDGFDKLQAGSEVAIHSGAPPPGRPAGP